MWSVRECDIPVIILGRGALGTCKWPVASNHGPLSASRLALPDIIFELAYRAAAARGAEGLVHICKISTFYFKWACCSLAAEHFSCTFGWGGGKGTVGTLRRMSQSRPSSVAVL